MVLNSEFASSKFNLDHLDLILQLQRSGTQYLVL